MKRLLLSVIILSSLSLFSQNKLISKDSLIGFDEQSIINMAPQKGITAEEMPYYIAIHKREFINQKYNIKTSIGKNFDYSLIEKTSIAACVNEDFEEAGLLNPVPSIISVTTSTDINGWGAYGASNSTSGVNDNCLNTYSYTTPNSIQLIAPGPAGLTDAIIGSGYKIYSVFGDTTITYPGAAIMDPFNHYGDWFAKINNQTPLSSVSRLTKTINVTPYNVYFNFAVMVVVEGSHGCCDGGAVSIIFKDCLGNLLATTQQYSVAAPMGCSTSSSVTILTSTVNPSWRYSKWANSSIDLTPWMGQCIVAEFTAFDCVYTGHAGYAYIDAQCGPTIINGINSLASHTPYKLYPNPNSGIFNLDINKEINNGEIELRNILGQIVYKQSVKQGINSLKTENLAKGIYNYSVLQNKEVINIGKIVIE